MKVLHFYRISFDLLIFFHEYVVTVVVFATEGLH